MDIKRILEPLLKETGVPVRWMIYTPDPKKPPPDAYLTYYVWDARAEVYADDAPLYGGIQGTVDVFSRTDPAAICKKVQKLLRRAGFTGLTYGPEAFESDTGLFHVPIDWYIEDFEEGTEE